jgi:uncharacterized protein YndB with AHSA1/START domain
MLRRLIVGASIAAAGWAIYYNVRRWYATWGFEADEQTKRLPGDEIIPDGANLLTRGITIDAPPEAVWPWLVQLGYERGGWYSYDQMDVRGKSADTILPEFQKLEVGDIVPTDPAGGFEVKLVEPGRALGLYVDTALVERQRKPAESVSVTPTPGLAMSGGMMSASLPSEFKISWTVVLEPDGSGKTRLIERARGWFGPSAASSRMLMPVAGFGIFVMTRKQMLGIRQRVERVASLERVEREAAIAVPMATHEGNGKGESQAPETIVASAG